MTPRDHCPACGAGGARYLADLPYDGPPLSGYLADFYPRLSRREFAPLDGVRYRLAECPACGCIYQDPVPDDAFLAEFYGREIHVAGQAAPDGIRPHEIEHLVRELMMVVRFRQPAVPAPRVLDFGTGSGNWALLAAAAGLDTHACDLSSHAYARLRVGGVVCHEPAGLPDDAFDFINTEQVLEHVRDPAAILQRLARALHPGGVLKIGVPHDPQVRRKLQRPDWTAPKNSPASLNAVAPIEHLNHFEPASLRALAARAALEPLAVLGWDLVPAADVRRHRSLRKRLGRWLRARLGQVHRPLWALTQTGFFLKPGVSPG